MSNNIPDWVNQLKVGDKVISINNNCVYTIFEIGYILSNNTDKIFTMIYSNGQYGSYFDYEMKYLFTNDPLAKVLYAR